MDPSHKSLTSESDAYCKPEMANNLAESFANSRQFLKEASSPEDGGQFLGLWCLDRVESAHNKEADCPTLFRKRSYCYSLVRALRRASLKCGEKWSPSIIHSRTCAVAEQAPGLCEPSRLELRAAMDADVEGGMRLSGRQLLRECASTGRLAGLGPRSEFGLFHAP